VRRVVQHAPCAWFVTNPRRPEITLYEDICSHISLHLVLSWVQSMARPPPEVALCGTVASNHFFMSLSVQGNLIRARGEFGSDRTHHLYETILGCWTRSWARLGLQDR
jgi:hypothetical protein